MYMKIISNSRKLLRPFTGTGGIFFPIGTPPKGTCEFSTKNCRKFCYAKNGSLFDFETEVPEDDKLWIYDQFMSLPINDICNKIINELDGLQTPILHWFGTGDCETKNTKRISSIIDAVPKYIVQMGFTRNIELWEKYKDIFALTIEDMSFMDGKVGMFACPDYEEAISIMRSSGYQVQGGYCGPLTCRDLVKSGYEHFINCQVCRKLKLGCFDRRVNI